MLSRVVKVIRVSTCLMTIVWWQLLDQHPDYSDGRAFAERYNWLVLPVVNPDGYEFSHVDDRYCYVTSAF